jgi:hypothetical protein
MFKKVYFVLEQNRKIITKKIQGTFILVDFPMGNSFEKMGKMIDNPKKSKEFP